LIGVNRRPGGVLYPERDAPPPGGDAHHRRVSRPTRESPVIPSPIDAAWPMFHRVWRHAALLDRMVAKLQVSPVAAARLDRGEALREARTRCLGCHRAADCADWMEASSGLPLPPSFCPNGAFFARCVDIEGARMHQRPPPPADD
jgi:hypothetical protein